MNLCFVTSEYAAFHRGGVEKVTLDLYEALKKKGHNVCVVSKDPPKENDENNSGDFWVLPSNEICSEVNKMFLSHLIECEKIEIFINQSHHQGVFELIAEMKEKCSVKIVTVLHTDPAFAVKGLRDQWDAASINKNVRTLLLSGYFVLRFAYRYYSRMKFLKHKYNAIYQNSDAVVLLSKQYMKKFAKIARLKKTNRIFSISNPVTKNDSEIRLSKKKQVLFVGRMENNAKRPDRMIQIWEQVCWKNPDWTLYMIGDGPMKIQLIQYCKEKKIPNIVFTGRTDPAPYYKDSIILCMTSTYEGFGLVLVEAQQNGVIPIAFDSYEAVRDIIEDNETGRLVKPFSLKKYSYMLSHLMECENQTVQLRGNILLQKSWERFNIDKVARQWECLFIELKVNLQNLDL